MRVFEKINDWLFYWGSRDERVRAGADRAGHVGFYLSLSCSFLFLLYLAFGGPLNKSVLQVLAFLVFLIPGVVYSLLWIRKGLSVLDSSVQKKFFRWLLVASPFLYGGIGWLTASHVGFSGLGLWIWVGASAVGGTALVALIVWLIDRQAKRRAEKMGGQES